MHRYNCIVCGTGFNAKGWEETKFCKMKCKKDYYGKNWKVGMFEPRTKQISYAKKIIFAGKMGVIL